MNCTKCGASLAPGTAFCSNCGAPVEQQYQQGQPQYQQQQYQQGQPQYQQQQYQQGQPQYQQQQYQQGQPQYYQQPYQQQVDPYAKSAYLAGLLALLLGAFGVHNFYLGNTGKGIAQLLLTLLGGWLFGLGAIAAAIWALIEGIMLFAGSITVDGRGYPLKKSF